MPKLLIGRLRSPRVERSIAPKGTRSIGPAEIFAISPADIDDNRYERVWRNSEFVWDIDSIGALGDVQDDDNWGILDYAPTIDRRLNRGPGLQLPRLWEIGADGTGVRIGIIDTGIDLLHPAFDRLRQEGRFKSFCEFDNDGQPVPQIDDNGDEIPDDQKTPTWETYHGTHCAAILVGNSTQRALPDGTIKSNARGAAPKAELVACRIVSSVASIMGGLYWLRDQHCDIISMSWGWDGLHEEWAEAVLSIVNSGTVFCVASGNAFTHSNEQNRSASPGNYPIPAPGFVSVGNLSRSNRVYFESGGAQIDWPATVSNANGQVIPSLFSGRRQIVPTLVAPGEAIISATPRTPEGDPRFESAIGTSMATPHVAGLIAAILSKLRRNRVDASPNEAAQIVLASVVDEPPTGQDIRFGLGRLDNDRLFDAVLRGDM